MPNREEILEQPEKNLDKTVFGDIGFIMKDGEIYGQKLRCFRYQKKKLDEAALASDTSLTRILISPAELEI